MWTTTVSWRRVGWGWVWLTAVGLVVWSSPCTAQEHARVARGEYHYQRYCAVCHGDDAKGAGPLAKIMTLTPSDLTGLSREHNGTFPFWYVYRAIDGREPIRGHGLRPMPIWGDEIRSEEFGSPEDVQEDLVAGRIWQMILYLESIQTP